MGCLDKNSDKIKFCVDNSDYREYYQKQLFTTTGKEFKQCREITIFRSFIRLSSNPSGYGRGVLLLMEKYCIVRIRTFYSGRLFRYRIVLYNHILQEFLHHQRIFAGGVFGLLITKKEEKNMEFRKAKKENLEQVSEIMKKHPADSLKFRPYKPSDAEAIVSWIKDETVLRKWSSDRFGDYPIKPEDINYKYLECNGDCEEPDNFYPMTAADENGPVGHLILRYTNPEKTTIRLGFIIVDESKRGKGYGKRMVQMATKYAFEMLKAEKVTLGVFDNNPAAYHCYKAAGFEEIKLEKEIVLEILGEQWKIIELERKRE